MAVVAVTITITAMPVNLLHPLFKGAPQWQVEQQQLGCRAAAVESVNAKFFFVDAVE